VGQGTAQREWQIRGDSRLTDVVEMDGVIYIGRDWLAARRLEINDRHLWIDGSGRLDDIGVELAGIPADAAILHVKAPGEGEGVLAAARREGSRWGQLRFRAADGLGNLRWQPGEVVSHDL